MEEINQTDDVVLSVLTLLLGVKIVEKPEVRAGLDTSLTYVRDEFLRQNKSKAAALIEILRQRTSDPKADPTLINLIRLEGAGSG